MSKYTSYVLFLLISIFVVILYVNNFGPLQSLQQTVTDLLVTMTTSDSERSNVVLVTIDGRAQDEFGTWPWNRDLIADLLAATATGEPKVIVADFDLSEDAFQDSAGYTGVLAGQLSWMENVVLTYDIALATYRSSKTNNPKHLFNHSLAVENPLGLMDEDASLQVRKVFLPAEKLLENDPLLGFNYIMPDDARVLRHQPLVMNYEGYYYPSTSLLAAAAFLDVKADDVRITEGNLIEVTGHGAIPVNNSSASYIRHHQASSFKHFSASDVLGEGFDFSRIKDKVVLVTLDDPSITETFHTPKDAVTPKYHITASVIDNIISRDVLKIQHGRTGMNLIVLFLLGAVCAFVLPQVSLLHRIIILVSGLIILGNINYFMISSFNMAPTTVFIGLEILLFVFAAAILEAGFLKGTAEATPDKVAKTSKPVAAQPTPMAAVPVREITAGTNDQDNLETAVLSVDNEKAPSISDHQAIDIDTPVDETSATPAMAESVPQSQDRTIDADIPIADTAAPEPEIISPQSTAEGDTFVEAEPPSPTMDTPPSGIMATELKSLGRYQITGILGKGAMGTVYRGVDPAINRPVALKTIRLDFVSDPEEMAELKERLHREAQAAGKLSHPNIVTIYDVGSEGHLQYIAMEYLEGRTLEDMIKKKTKFNYRIIAEIIMQICSALEYAHQQGIVHRDIKPANIMITKDYRAKVMDYGIARVESSSMTKTGIAMGTPNYMSPEQLKGQASDQRADLFSLGVVMYELLLGRRPFKGENITSLIYSILHQEPQKPSNINPQVPLLFDRIVDRALKKNVDERYQKATDVMGDLKDFVAAFAGKG
ncbi:MAG: protein kinase [candidate division Zixibacteria bacterium]|nr:protein kinase [candidate division Zixibacteria bacterium]